MSRYREVEEVIREPDEPDREAESDQAQEGEIVVLSIFIQIAFCFSASVHNARIMAEVERRLSVVEELEAVVAGTLQRATHLRQSILQKAFTGELLTADRKKKKSKEIHVIRG